MLAVEGNLSRTLDRQTQERNRKKFVFDDAAKVMRDKPEDQKDIEKAGMIGHKHIGLMQVQTFQPCNRDIESRESDANPCPAYQISLSSRLTSRKQVS